MRRRYTSPNRLSDVIRLLTILSIDRHAFRSSENLERAIRGTPLSANNWQEIAIQHPEFFRPNHNNEYVALLIRSYLPTKENDSRDPLTIDQTQKLIDVAISLHDKEIQRIQLFSFWFPIIVAIIAVAGVIYTANRSFNAKQKIELIENTLQQIKTQTDKIK
jgi:hypothetical protein